MNDNSKPHAARTAATPTATTTPRATPNELAEARVAEGLWGGQHVRLEVNATGAIIEFDCGHGTLDAPLTLQAGRFDVAGTYVREGGPTRVNDTRKGRPARFKGQVEGTRMMLTFALAGAEDEADTFTLTRGEAARLFKCR